MTVAITFREDGPWGAGKGSKLTKAEGDTNFYNLKLAVETLQALGLEPNNIASITSNAGFITFTFQDASTITVPWPVLAWRYRGDYAADTVYDALDTFTAPGEGIYLVLIGHTSPSVFDPDLLSGGNPVYQQLLPSVGSAGIGDLSDMNITSPAEKDMLVYDLASAKWLNKTPAQVTANLPVLIGDSGSGGTKGLVPAPAAGDAADRKVLLADGTWDLVALSELAGVDSASVGSPTDGQLLIYDVDLGGWKAADVPGVSNTLGSLTDVNLTGPTDGQALIYDSGSGKWVNDANGITALTGDVTASGSGSVVATLANSGASAGSYSNANVTVNAKGLITAISNGSAAITSAAVDSAFGSTRGSILYRGASGWTILTPGTSGQILEAQGAGADPHWATVSGVSNTLAGLTDVNITGPAASNFITYDLSSTKWVNKTHAQATALLDAMIGDSGSGGTKGLVPAPATGDAAAAKFLKADGTWAVPAGGSAMPGGSSNSIQYNNSGAFGGISLTDGQLLIGRTGNSPLAATLTAGAGISINSSSGSVEISATGGASGSGGSGVGLYGQTMSSTPTQAGTGLTTAVNQGTATMADGTTGIVVVGATAASQISGVSKAAPSTPYTIDVLIENGSTQAPNGFGPLFGWYDGTKLHVFAMYTSTGGVPTLYVLRYATTGSGNTAAAIDATVLGHPIHPAALRIKDDGTTVYFQIGPAGCFDQAQTVYSVAKASGYLSAYSNIFFGINKNNGLQYGVLMSYTEG